MGVRKVIVILSLCRPPCSHLPKLQACLQSSDVNYRIAVGETIALLVEQGRDIEEVNTHLRIKVFSGFDVIFPCYNYVTGVFVGIRGGGQ